MIKDWDNSVGVVTVECGTDEMIVRLDGKPVKFEAGFVLVRIDAEQCLVSGQGHFGMLDGPLASAMRVQPTVHALIASAAGLYLDQTMRQQAGTPANSPVAVLNGKTGRA